MTPKDGVLKLIKLRNQQAGIISETLVPSSVEASTDYLTSIRNKSIRPQEPGIMQLEMRGLDEYEIFVFPESYDFDDPERVRLFMRLWPLPEERAEWLFTMAANYGAANIDLRTGLVLPVIRTQESVD